jgi:hypothetical protein
MIYQISKLLNTSNLLMAPAMEMQQKDFKDIRLCFFLSAFPTARSIKKDESICEPVWLASLVKHIVYKGIQEGLYIIYLKIIRVKKLG